MSDMPERISALECKPNTIFGRIWEEPTDSFDLYTEYVRADKYAELEEQNRRLVELLKDAQEIQTEFDTEWDIAVREALASMEKTMMSDDTVEIVYKATMRVPKNTTEKTLDEMQGLIGDFIDDQPDAYLLMDALSCPPNMRNYD
jgi:hypothetical protein